MLLLQIAVHAFHHIHKCGQIGINLVDLIKTDLTSIPFAPSRNQIFIRFLWFCGFMQTVTPPCVAITEKIPNSLCSKSLPLDPDQGLEGP